jgi:kynurenine formamidase
MLANIGLEVAKWCIDKHVCVTGADERATEVVPNPNKNLAFPVHQELIPKNGIYNHENLDFTGLIADRKYQFVYDLARFGRRRWTVPGLDDRDGP